MLHGSGVAHTPPGNCSSQVPAGMHAGYPTFAESKSSVLQLLLHVMFATWSASLEATFCSATCASFARQTAAGSQGAVRMDTFLTGIAVGMGS